MAVPFCLLLNRANFLRDRNIATRGVSESRAELCELLAIKTLRHWAGDTIDLATVLTTSWMVFAGADEQVMVKVEDYEEDLDTKMRVGNAIEMAILSQAKRFIKSAAAQKIIGKNSPSAPTNETSCSAAFTSCQMRSGRVASFTPQKDHIPYCLM